VDQAALFENGSISEKDVRIFLRSDLAISVQNRLNQWTGLTGFQRWQCGQK
jgi:hypothetical protein